MERHRKAGRAGAPRRRLAPALGLLLAACLPEGGPALGTQLVAGRGLADVAFSRELGDGTGALVLYTRPVDEPDPVLTRGLFMVARHGGPPRALVTGIAPQARNSFFWDARGRLYFPSLPANRDDGSTWELSRIDLQTGVETLIGRVRSVGLSVGREQLFVETLNGDARLHGVDDVDRPVGGGLRQAVFVGEDLAFIDEDGLGWLGRRDREPRILLAGALAFRPLTVAAEGATLLATRRPPGGSSDLQVVTLSIGADGTVAPPFVLVQAPMTGVPFLSPDGKRLAFGAWIDAGTRLSLRMLDLDSGEDIQHWESLAAGGPTRPPPGETPAPPVGNVTLIQPMEFAFRPGDSGELWCLIGTTLRVLRPDGTVVVARRPIYSSPRIGPGWAAQPLGEGPDRSSPFTADGQRWLFRGNDGGLYLGPASAPDLDGPGTLLLAAANRGGRVVEIDPGRRLAVWVAPGQDRQDLYALDLDRPSAALRFLARDVGSTVFGARRVLAIARKLGDRRATGDLVLVDLTSAEETLLAQNVGEFALAPVCRDCDPTGPGVAVAYSVQGRVPYSREGLWLGTLP